MINLEWWQWFLLGGFGGCCLPSLARHIRARWQNLQVKIVEYQLFGPKKKLFAYLTIRFPLKFLQKK